MSHWFHGRWSHNMDRCVSSVQVSSVQDGFQSSGKATDHPISQDISPALPVALETVQMSGYPNMQLGFRVKCSWSLLMQPVWNWAKGGCITGWLSDWEWPLCEVNPGVWGHILQRSETADLKALYTTHECVTLHLCQVKPVHLDPCPKIWPLDPCPKIWSSSSHSDYW